MIAETGQFHTKLESYNGPLDLLLYLIKEQEVEITNLPIIQITEQYLEMVGQIEKFDPNEASEFLVLAATLIEIKSKMLLPREEVDFSEIEDPRSDLIEQLLAYQEFKNKARNFGSLFEDRKLRFTRGRNFELEDGEEVQVELGDLNSWDLLTLMEKIVSETLKEIPDIIAYDDIPISVHMDQIVKDLDTNKSISFRQLVKKYAHDRIHLVGMFVAILELARRKYVRIEQSKDFSDIHLLTVAGKDYESLKFSEDEIVSSTEPQTSLEEEFVDEDEDLTFDLKKDDENHSMDIDGFYKTNFRKDKDENGEEQKLEEVEELSYIDDEDVPASQDVEEELLEIIRTKIPVPIFTPEEEDLKLWRQANPDTSVSDFDEPKAP